MVQDEIPVTHQHVIGQGVQEGGKPLDLIASCGGIARRKVGSYKMQFHALGITESETSDTPPLNMIKSFHLEFVKESACHQDTYSSCLGREARPVAFYISPSKFSVIAQTNSIYITELIVIIQFFFLVKISTKVIN